jgi:GYF domain 2
VNPRTSFPPHWEAGRSKSQRGEASRQKDSPASDIWYFANQSVHIGPLSLQQLKQTLRTVENAADVPVWCDTFADWKCARDVPELAEEPGELSPTAAATTPEAADADSSLRKSSRWLLSWALPLLGSAANRTGHEVMRRLSADRRIRKEVSRWLSEGPPDVVINIARAARANLLLVLVAAACVGYGFYDGLVLNSLSSGLIVGFLLGGLAILAIVTARKYRVKKPTPRLIWIGNIAYWIGWALAAYGLFLVVHEVSHTGLVGGLKAAGSLLPSVIFYLTAGWSVRYMLGQ